jgi:DNA-binding protein YbaB
MDKESNGLAGLLNISTPANPGKPVPWTPRPAAGRPEPAAAATAPGGEPAEEARAQPSPGPGGTAGPSGPAGPLGPGGTAGPADPVAQRVPNDGPAELPPWDPAAVSEIFGRTMAAAEAQQARLEQAMADARERTYVAESADGDVRVTVDGRPRVTEVYVSARAVRNGPGPLGAAITEAANAAVRVAREGANEALLDGLDPAMRAAVAEGLSGPAGSTGSAGPTGSPGSTGPKGSTGPTRPAG